MMDPDSPQADAFRSLFLTYRPATARPATAKRLETMSLRAEPALAAKPFSFFRSSDLERATQLADEFDEIAGHDPSDERLRLVMKRFHEVAQDDVQLAQWALRLFIARRPGADILPMPTLRQQLAVHQNAAPHLFAKVMALAPSAPASSEDAMRYFRHDIDLSDHHLHWHILYSHNQPKNPALQGQLFLYMHEQCLARYDTERHCAGLPLVASFLKWDDPAGQNLFGDTNLPVDSLATWIPAVFSTGTFVDFDEGGKSPQQLDADDVTAVLSQLKTIAANIKAGKYTDYNALGTDIEANTTSTLDAEGPHNAGHVALSSVPSSTSPTVMVTPSVAMTTPIFYRWHRAIDDYGFAWQEAQAPFSWTSAAPPLQVRRSLAGGNSTSSPDLILTLRSQIPNIDQPGFDLQKFGESNFGGAAFDQPANHALNVDTLRTTMVDDQQMGERRLQLQDHWVYFLRLRNQSNSDVGATVRIWLAHRELAASRRHWIEMDKFVVVVPANSKSIVARPCWQSTVIRAKSVSDLMQLASQDDNYNADDPKPMQARFWCECGLPYRLLLPKGTTGGAPFRFLVMLTDAGEDGLQSEAGDYECGSVSFCGKNNWTWPDKKTMGFPFDRRFQSAGVDPVFAALDPLSNVVWRDVTITAV